MYFGIDLGTTNSLIGRGDKMYTGLVSSSVDFATRRQVERNVATPTSYSSYKANMTTGDTGKMPMDASSIILRTLADKVYAATGELCQDVVISVPAKFTNTQRTAVKLAAEKAGLNLKGLINEPTAAAICVCKEQKKHVVVFDLGGGTFDVTLLDSRFGSYMVEATEGIILAGDDFDKALLDYAMSIVKLPIRYRTPINMKQMLARVRLVKEEIQATKQAAILSLTDILDFPFECEISVDTYVAIMKDVFAPTLKLSKKLLMTYTYDDDLPEFVFVGGSTICPYLREWIASELGFKSYLWSKDADFIVARGVALYALMLETGEAETQVDDVTQRLSIEDAKGWAMPVIEKNSIIPTSASITVCNEVAGDELTLDLYSGDETLCSQNEYLGTLHYKYNKEMAAQEGWVEVTISVDRNGLIHIVGTDILTQEQQEIKIVRN